VHATAFAYARADNPLRIYSALELRAEFMAHFETSGSSPCWYSWT